MWIFLEYLALQFLTRIMDSVLVRSCNLCTAVELRMLMVVILSRFSSFRTVIGGGYSETFEWLCDNTGNQPRHGGRTEPQNARS